MALILDGLKRAASGLLTAGLLLDTTGIPAQTKPSIRIDGQTAILVSASEPQPIQLAVRDLASDMQKVFGVNPRIVHSRDAGGTLLAIGSLASGCGRALTTSESFCLQAARVQVAGTHHAMRDEIELSGADMRGTIYAIYTFSKEVLGVDPMYFWTDNEPQHRSSIQLPANYVRTDAGPLYAFRGFFINDEDLLTGWAPGKPSDHSGISLEVWDKIFETILRLKGNIIVPGTWIFPDDAQVEAASRRGLIVNQHHAIPLGVNVARWPEDVPYNFSTHPEILERAWTNAVSAYKSDEEILWAVGLRGLSDQGYAALDPSVRNNDQLLGKLVSRAIADQMAIVRARFPKARFVTNLWQEGEQLQREGYLKIPPEVTLVWADTGYGDMQDGGKVSAGQGMYFHVAMMNSQANQLSEMVPVERIRQEMGRYIKAGATGYFLVNTSDIRPVAMTARAVMDIAWGGLGKETADADGTYYRAWASKEFGPKSANALEAVYKEYFAAPALHAPYGPPGTAAGNFAHWYGDQFYHTEARWLILQKLSDNQVIWMPSQSPKWEQPGLMRSGPPDRRKAGLTHVIELCAAAQPRWDAVWAHAVAAEKFVDPSRRNYYQAQVLTMITINRESNRMLLELARALQADDAGDTATAKTETAESLRALDSIRQSMSAAEYGKWKNWYRGDWLTGVYRTHELVQDYANHLNDPMAKLPAPTEWSSWEAYFHIMEYEDDRAVDVR